jgi:hypothetical protein
VKELAVQIPSEAIPATELPLRTHEILEDALRDELSGDDDYGSGTDMASVEADVDGTRELLSLLAPLLDQRAPDLVSTVTSELNTLDTALAAARVNGQWVEVADVPLAQREQVDGAIGQALETLDLVPELLQVVGSTAESSFWARAWAPSGPSGLWPVPVTPTLPSRRHRWPTPGATPPSAPSLSKVCTRPGS